MVVSMVLFFDFGLSIQNLDERNDKRTVLDRFDLDYDVNNNAELSATKVISSGKLTSSEV